MAHIRLNYGLWLIHQGGFEKARTSQTGVSLKSSSKLRLIVENRPSL